MTREPTNILDKRSRAWLAVNKNANISFLMKSISYIIIFPVMACNNMQGGIQLFFIKSSRTKKPEFQDIHMCHIKITGKIVQFELNLESFKDYF